jgi:tetratricopeptide (TPR) repeat protein
MTIKTLTTCLLTYLLLQISIISFPQNSDPEVLLERYLETGDNESKEKIKELFPESAYHHFCDTYELLHVDDKKAKELAEALIREHPDFALGYFALGTIYGNRLGQYSTAIIQFNRSIELDPQFPSSWLNRGMAKIGLKDFKGAREDFNQAVTLKRGYALGYILRGVSNYGLGDTDAMLTDLEIGLQLDFKALSKVLYLAGDAVDRSIEMAPENVNYYFARGYAYFVNENYRSALADFTTAVNMVSGSSEFLKYAGATKVFLEDAEGAQTDLNIALGINPDDPDIYYYLGIIMNDIEEQPSRAYEYLNLAIELDDTKPEYFYQRSRASYNLIDLQSARDDVNMALYLDHHSGDFYALRGQIKMKVGSPAADYCHDFRRAIEWGTSYNLKRIMKKSCPE